MTLDQLIAEVASKPTQVEAFTTLMTCLQIEMNDAIVGDSPPPSVQSKFDSVFSQASGKAAEILNAIETGKPALDPIVKAPVPASDPGGPVTKAAEPVVFKDKPIPVAVDTSNANIFVPAASATSQPAV
jgi:hypothetical protein